jgi:hypothetical protein
VWQSRHGVLEFFEWREFATTDLLYASYLQWHQGRGGWPLPREQLGVRMARLYRRSRPRGIFIIAEALTMGTDNKVVIKKAHPTGYVVGKLDHARGLFADEHGLDRARWPAIDDGGPEIVVPDQGAQGNGGDPF